jgi:biotin operon repressor
MGSEWPRDRTFREQWWKQIRSDPRLRKDLLTVALIISTEARWQDGTHALISQKQIAADLGKSVPMIERHIRTLRELGYLKVAQKGGYRGDGSAAANVYDLSQPITQMMGGEAASTHQIDASTHQIDASTHHFGVSTHHPDDGPLSYSLSLPLSDSLRPGEAGPGHEDPAPPATTSRQRARQAIAPHPMSKTAKDERLFAQILEVDQLNLDGRRIDIAELYLTMRSRHIWFPGSYLEKISADGASGVDNYLASLDMTRS